MHDLVIVGGGPAGMTAAINAASEGLDTVLVEKGQVGGRAATSPLIENVLGWPQGFSGRKLSRWGRQQIEKFKCEIVQDQAVGLIPGADGHTLDLGMQPDVTGRNVILANGVGFRTAPIPGVDDYLNKGVTYGNHLMPSHLVKGKCVVIIGGGNSAGQAALHFAAYADCVVVAVRGKTLADKMSKYLLDRIDQTGVIKVLTESHCEAVVGDGTQVIGVVLRQGGVKHSIIAHVVCLFIGQQPQTQWLRGSGVKLDTEGYVRTGGRGRLQFETAVPGVFAAGDVRSQSVKRMGAAAGEGSMVVQQVWDWRRRLGI